MGVVNVAKYNRVCIFYNTQSWIYGSKFQDQRNFFPSVCFHYDLPYCTLQVVVLNNRYYDNPYSNVDKQNGNRIEKSNNENSQRIMGQSSHNPS